MGDFAKIYALSCGEKLRPKSTFVEKNDKYEFWVWVGVRFKVSYRCPALVS